MTKRSADTQISADSTQEMPEPQLIVGDCFTQLKKISDGAVKLVFSSPPYNIGKKYEKNQELEEYLKFQQLVIAELCRVVSEDGCICWQVGNNVVDGTIRPLDLEVEPLFSKHGCRLRKKIAWTFGHGLHCSNRFSGRYEMVAIFSRRDLKPRTTSHVLLEKEWSSGIISDAPNVKANHVEKTSHPCQFPIELVERFILKLTDDGDTVLDPFAGVCTTAIAAWLNDRQSICMEIKPEYVSIGRSRYNAARNGHVKKRSLGTKIHVPDPKVDSVAKRPAEFDKAVNLSLQKELSFSGNVSVKTVPWRQTPFHNLLLLSSTSASKVTSAFSEKFESLAVVVDAPELESEVYQHCRSVGLTLLNRVLVVGAGYRTIFWFVKDVSSYTFDLDAVRVPSKYPGKKVVGGSEFSGNALGKNPSDVWAYCDHTAPMCSLKTAFGLPQCCVSRVVRAFVPVDGTVCCIAEATSSSEIITALKRNLVCLTGF